LKGLGLTTICEGQLLALPVLPLIAGVALDVLEEWNERTEEESRERHERNLQSDQSAAFDLPMQLPDVAALISQPSLQRQ
jgi:hypothetical protein